MFPVTFIVADILTRPLEAGATPLTDRDGWTRESVEVQRWLQLAKAGDQTAFGRLIDLHQRIVFRTALAALGRPEDAEDASQDAFLLAWRKLSGFRGESTFRTWLLTIVWRKALDRRRARLVWWKRLTPQRDDVDLFEDLPGNAPSPEQSTLARDTARRARREIARLSPKLRDTLLLAASGEHSYEDISAMLGTPLGTIKWRVSEARRIVSARLER